MISIGRFLGHDQKFYDLLEASAQQADTSVHHLVDLLAKIDSKDSFRDLEAFAESRREDKRITQQLTEELTKTFITPLEREDIQKIGGMEALDEPYTTIPLLRMVKKRATWLIILFLGEMLTATAMQGYNGEIEKAAILAMFLPLIISSGGNSGSQATTLVIRAMALGELRLRDWFRVVRKELLSGLSLGLILGTIGFFRISLWQYLHIFDYGKYHWLVAVTVGAALVGVVLWGTISGAMLPFLLRRLGLDPATSSAPFVATLVDVTGLIIYFNVALFILRGTLL